MKLTHIDIHSHLNLSPLYDRREEILERMREDGIGTITVGTGLQTSQRAVEIAEQNPGLCWATVGVHPCDIPTQTLPKGEGFAPGYLTGNDNKIESLLKKAKEMRKSPTQTEEIIWEILRDEKLGFQFRRQHIIDHFIIDFVCLKKGLIIEIDGDIHDLQKERDIERDNRLKELGFSILRFSNDNILSDIDMVISKIKETIKFSSQVSPLLWGGVRGEDLNLGGAFDDEWSQICRLATHPSVVAIGETGLDYFHDDTPEMCDVQTEVFKKHIELAVSVNKPLMLHVRSSRGSDDVYYDALEILNEYAQSPSPAKGRVEVGFDDKTPSGLSATSPFAGGRIPDFTITGSRILSLGWLSVDTAARGEDVELPKTNIGETLQLIQLNNTEKYTTPPNRYSEAGLIKELEERGIGRPSTYASIMKTLEDRGYVTKEGRTLYPTDTGDVVSSFLEEHFAQYISDTFTADMENKLDNIADGSAAYVKTLSDFYTPFSADVASKENIAKVTNLGVADSKHVCPKCGSAMEIKLGRSGKFLSCNRYPECDGALTIDGDEVGEEKPFAIHPATGEPIYLLTGRFGPYVQLGKSPAIPKLTKWPKGYKKTAEDKEQVKAEKLAIEQAKLLPQPKRASLPPRMKPEDMTVETAVKLLELPKDLGADPETGIMVIANVGRFGPYVGRDRDFRSIKKPLDPYTITLDQALTLLNTPKALPKGTELIRTFIHTKTKKELRVLKSKSGNFIGAGLKRIYLPDNMDPTSVTDEELTALVSLGVEKKGKKN